MAGENSQNPTFKKLQDEIASAMVETLNDSKLSDLLVSYGLGGEITQIKCTIDINKMKSNQKFEIKPEVRQALEAMSDDTLDIMLCCCIPRVCCPCCNCP